MKLLRALILFIMLFQVQNSFAQTSESTKDISKNLANKQKFQTREYKNQFPYIENQYYSLVSGSLSGIYYPTAEAICRVSNRDHMKKGQRCMVEASPGSIYNLRALKDAEANLALVQSDWQEHAVNGTSIFSEEGGMDKLRHVMSLYTEAINVVVKKDSNLYILDDLKAKVVNFGPKGSGSRASIEELMKVKGWSNNVFASIAELRDSEQPAALCDGRIDVMIVAAGTPNKTIKDATSRCEVRMIEVTGDDISQFVNNNPRYSLTTIPGGIYNGVPSDIRTYGFKATLVTTIDTSEQIVYNITKSVFENLKQFKTLHPVLNHLDETKMISEGKTAELHPGAEKYYKEAGLL